MTPQEKYVLDYIERHGSITANEAHDDIGINRLASRINDLIPADIAEKLGIEPKEG